MSATCCPRGGLLEVGSGLRDGRLFRRLFRTCRCQGRGGVASFYGTGVGCKVRTRLHGAIVCWEIEVVLRSNHLQLDVRAVRT